MAFSSSMETSPTRPWSVCRPRCGTHRTYWIVLVRESIKAKAFQTCFYIARECRDPPPTHIYNMDKTWPWKNRKNGDVIKYTCPPRKFITEPLPEGAKHLAHKYFIEYGHDIHPLRGKKIPS